MKFVQNNWTVPQRGSLWILSVVYNFPHYLGYPLCIILDHHFTWWHQKMGGDVPLLVFPAQEVRGTLEAFGIQKNHLGSTPLWFQIPRVALMDAENCLLGILNSSSLGPDSPLPDDYGWLRVPTQPQPHPNPSQPISYLSSPWDLLSIDVPNTKYQRLRSQWHPPWPRTRGQSKAKWKERKDSSGGFLETTQNGKICPR